MGERKQVVIADIFKSNPKLMTLERQIQLIKEEYDRRDGDKDEAYRRELKIYPLEKLQQLETDLQKQIDIKAEIK